MWMDELADGGFYKFGYTTVVKKKKRGEKVITELRKCGLCFTGGLETGRSELSPSAVHDKLTHVWATPAMPMLPLLRERRGKRSEDVR